MKVFNSLSILLCVCTCTLGLWQWSRCVVDYAGNTAGPEAREQSQFLELARSTVGTGRTLVITSLAPVPDSDYWFGLREPSTTWVVVDRARMIAQAPGQVIPPEEEIVAYLDGAGLLLTRSRWIEGGDFTWVVATDPVAKDRLLALVPELSGHTVLSTVRGAVFRVKP